MHLRGRCSRACCFNVARVCVSPGSWTSSTRGTRERDAPAARCRVQCCFREWHHPKAAPVDSWAWPLKAAHSSTLEELAVQRGAPAATPAFRRPRPFLRSLTRA